MAAIEVPTFEQIATILSQLATNYSNVFADYYNLFYNPTPMDVTVQIYNEAGNLTTITIPNRAKDRAYILNGNGDPNNNVSAPKGSLYQDLANGVVYIKQFASTGNTGWSEFMTLESLEDYLIQGAGSPEGIVAAAKGILYVDKMNAALYLKSTATGNTGWILISADTSTLANKELSNLVEGIPGVGDNYFLKYDWSNLSTQGTGIINSKENVSNKTATIDSSSTDVQYPTAKAVYDLVGTGTSDLADKSLSNLNEIGEDKFVHTETQVRDCIFKAPNGFLSVSGNVISLPSGTVLLCANGVNNDNQAVNEKITTASALSESIEGTSARSCVVFFNGTSNILLYYNVDNYFRQIEQPDSYADMIWYNPNENNYKVTSDSGSTWTTIKATEIGRFTTDGSGVINSFYPYHPFVAATQDDIAVIQDDIDEIVTDLNGKADVDLSNVNDTAKILMAGMGMPSETYIDLTLNASDSTYTAPANGWVQVSWQISSNSYLAVSTVYDNSDGICMQTQNFSSSGSFVNVYIPVSKNEVFKVAYNGTLQSNQYNRFLFIYAKGSESEGS